MAKKHDGWIIKDLRSDQFRFSYLRYWRSSCIDKFNELWGKGAWQKCRRKGTHKLVKVKLVEVE